jgi:endonuclease/exonuclease/phosphatase (EEP) superfamily protein YafD
VLKRRETGRFLAAGLLTVLFALGVLPDLLLGLDRYSPFAYLVAFRPYTTAGTDVLALFAVGAAILRRPTWPFAAGLVAIGVIGTSMVIPRMVPAPAPTSGRALTVLSFNVFDGNADVDALAVLIREGKPDLVSMPEAGEPYRAQLASRLHTLGYRLISSTSPDHPDGVGVTMAIAPGLGDVNARVGAPTSYFPYLDATGGGLGRLHFNRVPRSASDPE